MKTLSYKGYVGSVEMSEADNCLYGEVLGLPKNTAITYEGQTVAELKADFEGAIDDYLTTCATRGINPHRSYTGTLNVRLKSDTHLRIATLAAERGISINAYIQNALDEKVKEMETV